MWEFIIEKKQLNIIQEFLDSEWNLSNQKDFLNQSLNNIYIIYC